MRNNHYDITEKVVKGCGRMEKMPEIPNTMVSRETSVNISVGHQ